MDPLQRLCAFLRSASLLKDDVDCMSNDNDDNPTMISGVGESSNTTTIGMNPSSKPNQQFLYHDDSHHPYYPPSHPTTTTNTNHLKGIQLAHLIGNEINFTAEESREIYVGIYGRQPPEIKIWEERLDELEHEIWSLPNEKKATFVRLIRKDPLFFATHLQHVRLFLIAENYNPKRAAKRIASYWEKREKLFSEEELPLPGKQLSMKDFIRFYERSEKVIDNTDSDDIARDVAREYIRCVNLTKTASLNKMIVQLLKKEISLLARASSISLAQAEASAAAAAAAAAAAKAAGQSTAAISPTTSTTQQQGGIDGGGLVSNGIVGHGGGIVGDAITGGIGNALYNGFGGEEKKDSLTLNYNAYLQLDDDEKMLFIRSVNFFEDKAAERMINLWNMKHELFGPILSIKKKITLQDLITNDSNNNHNHQNHNNSNNNHNHHNIPAEGYNHYNNNCWNELQLGFIRIMPGTDSYNRKVILIDTKVLNDLKSNQEDNVIKICWYVIHAALEEKKCQRNGIVLLINLRGGTSFSNLLLRMKFGSKLADLILKCIPIQIKAIHIFSPPLHSFWQHLIKVIFKFPKTKQQQQSTAASSLSSSTIATNTPIFQQQQQSVSGNNYDVDTEQMTMNLPQILTKVGVLHAGVVSQKEELIDLKECGIEVDQLPIDLGGNVKFDSYVQWLEDRMVKRL